MKGDVESSVSLLSPPTVMVLVTIFSNGNGIKVSVPVSVDSYDV